MGIDLILLFAIVMSPNFKILMGIDLILLFSSKVNDRVIKIWIMEVVEIHKCINKTNISC